MTPKTPQPSASAHQDKVPANLLEDFATLGELASREALPEVRQHLAALIEKYRVGLPELAERLEQALVKTGVGKMDPGAIRGDAGAGLPPSFRAGLGPVPFLIVPAAEKMSAPILPPELMHSVECIIREHREREKLAEKGISPTRSAAFVGPPGVGKTLTAKYIAHRLGKPLWVLDLAALMGGFGGNSGAAIHGALQLAKSSGAVLLIDELDAIAMQRDVGADDAEPNRLAAIVLQEVDLWPDTCLLLGATNHPELVDIALWRRFDAYLQFPLPDAEALETALGQFLGVDFKAFAPVASVLSAQYIGKSLSEVRREIETIRRAAVFEDRPVYTLVEETMATKTDQLTREQQMAYAAHLLNSGDWSHHEISKKTGLARDTLRKHFGPSTNKRRGRR